MIDSRPCYVCLMSFHALSAPLPVIIVHCRSFPSPTMPSQPTAPPNFSSTFPIVSFFPGSPCDCALAARISATAASLVSVAEDFQDGSEET